MARRTLVSAANAGTLLASHIALLNLFLNPDAGLARPGMALLVSLFLPYAAASTILLGALALAAGRFVRARAGHRPPVEGLPWLTSLAFLATAASAALYWMNLLSY